MHLHVSEPGTRYGHADVWCGVDDLWQGCGGGLDRRKVVPRRERRTGLSLSQAGDSASV